MTRKALLTSILLLIVSIGYSQNTIDALRFLIGTWKVEGKESYEVWSESKKALTGSSYKLRNGEKLVAEHLSLKSVNGKIVYAATVMDQNEGATISFTLNADISKGYSFENPTHDFPTKIIYQKINDSEVTVRVLGSDEKGFTLTLIKQE